MLNQQEQRRAEDRQQLEKREAEKLEQNEQQRAETNLREATLQAYLDRISELLTNKALGNQAWKENPARAVARARTLTVLRSLNEDGRRKEAILHFLHEAKLIQVKSPIISLESADLHGAFLYGTNLKEANLEEANLYGANLIKACLYGAFLYEADLKKACLYEADLRKTNLSKADLRETNLHEANLKDAIFDEGAEGTKFPDGFKPYTKGMKKRT